MIQRITEKKVSGGKYVRVTVHLDEWKVTSAAITGDFFLHPEEALDSIERSLIGIDVRDRDSVKRSIENVITSGRIKIIGFSAQDLADLVVGGS